MCGISGIMYGSRRQTRCKYDNFTLMKRMLDAIAYRGPDGEGICSLNDGNVYLGHRRLAVIDLSENASQPMTSENKRYTISYNGEIYNYLELKKELIEKGHKFFSSSDTEVILNAFDEWGTECFNKLNGIFAFVIWDNGDKNLYLVRDRYGAKPLYYSSLGEVFLFGSEYKAIIQYPDFPKKINLSVLKEYFTFQNIFSNQCFLEHIELLPQGSYLKIHSESIQEQVLKQYWDYDFTEPDNPCRREEYEEELQFLLKRAIKRQLIGDVALGTYLSGGMDSGSITAVASKEIPYIKSFTCGFDLHSASGMELFYDEREKAELMSYFFKTEHYEIVVKSGDMERCMADLIWHIEDPRVGQCYPNYYAAKLSSQFVKVVLAGTGGDELFAGYPWRYYQAVNCNNFDDYVSCYYKYWQRLTSTEELENLLKPVSSECKNISSEQIFRNVFKNRRYSKLTPEQSINCSLYFEAKTFLQGLLIIEDKISMAYGLETRIPFLDNDLVDFAMKLPIHLKVNNLSKHVNIDENDFERKKDKYFQKTNDGKQILRNIMAKQLPSEVTAAKKQGFSAPDASWYRGDSIDYVKSIVYNANAPMYRFIDRNITIKMINEHIQSLRNRRLFVWSILSFDQWCKTFL